MFNNHHQPAKLILPFHTLDSLRIRIGWIINLRWMAVFGLLSAIPVAQRILHFKIAYPQLYAIVFLLTVLNLLYFFFFRYYPFSTFRQELFFTELQSLIDLIIISFLVHYIGGIGNPFFFIYIVNIIISGVLFVGSVPYLNAAVAAILLTIWSMLEYHGLVTCYSVGIEQISLSMLIVSLCAFYLLVFTATYVIKDFISGYRHLKSVIDEKSHQLENTIKERDKIFRFTAHELKSPLTTLRSMLAVLEQVYSQKLSDEVSDMLQRSVRRTDQVLDMVKDMIDVTQYRHGVTESVIEKVNFNHWIAKVVNQQQAYAANKNITLKIEKLPADPEVLQDCTSVEKILTNLVNNAIRYSSAGKDVQIIPLYKSRIYGFSVKDQGIGISPEDRKKIFDEFFRGKNARDMEHLGTGLGLPLVQQIIEQLDGQIFVESELGQGSTFTIELPKKDIA